MSTNDTSKLPYQTIKGLDTFRTDSFVDQFIKICISPSDLDGVDQSSKLPLVLKVTNE